MVLKIIELNSDIAHACIRTHASVEINIVIFCFLNNFICYSIIQHNIRNSTPVSAQNDFRLGQALATYLIREMIGSEEVWFAMSSFCESVFALKEKAERKREQVVSVPSNVQGTSAPSPSIKRLILERKQTPERCLLAC